MNFVKNNRLVSTRIKVTMTALAFGVMTLSHSAFAANTQILDLSTTQKSEETTELRFSFAGKPVAPKISPLSNRVFIDFHSVSTSLPQQEKTIKVGTVKSSQFSSFGDNTRVMLNLQNANNKTSYYIDGNDVVLVVKKANSSTVNSDNEPDAFYGSDEGLVDMDNQPTSNGLNSPTHVSVTPSHGAQKRSNPLLSTYISEDKYNYDGLSSVNFSGTSSGGNVSIALTDEAVPVDVQRQGNKIVIRMKGSTVPKNLLRRMSVDNKLVSSISASNKGKNGSVTVHMAGDFEYQAYQSGNQLSIDVSAPKLLSEATIEEKVYSGEPISLQFQKVEVRNILQMLADFTDMNIVVNDSVRGDITLRLINVPWDQALDIILESKNLDKRINGNTITVAPAAELNKRESDALKSLQSKEDLQPLRTEYIRLSYSKVDNIIKLISQGKNSGSSRKNDTGTLLSKRGTVTSDNRTNTLIVKDTSQSIENIRALISKIDIPVKQVMVEARIVSASDSFSKEIGVKWGILSNGAATNDNLIVGPNLKSLSGLRDYDVASTTVNGKNVSYPEYDIDSKDRLNVNLGASKSAGRIAFGLLGLPGGMLDLELSAMQADSRGEVISSPKILTADKQKAKVISGTQIPYLEASASGAATTAYKEAALSLEVTPNITPEGRVGMLLNITNDSPKMLENGTLAIDTTQVNTNVVIEDGQTVVLGGVFKNNTSNAESKVPFLGDLPFVGKLFSNDKRTTEKQEVLIFITPRIVNDGTSNF